MNTDKFQTEESLIGDSVEDTQKLQQMAKATRQYLQSFTWCPPIERIWLAHGIGGIVAVFLVKFVRSIGEGDDLLWVVNGDVPNAYMVTDNISNPKEALQTYCELMEDWISAVNKGASLKDLFPVGVEPTLQNASKLSGRINYIKNKIISSIEV